MRRFIYFFLPILVIHTIGAQVSADSIYVPNQGFEDPVGNGNILTSSWVRVNNNFPFDTYNVYEFNGGNAYYLGANSTTDPANGGAGYPGIQGENLGYVWQEGPGSGLGQTLTATLTADTNYTLTVAEGARNGSLGGPFSGSTIELLAGSTVIASSTDDIGPTPGTFKDEDATLANSDVYPSLIGEPLTIELLTSLPFTAVFQATDWDNVRLTATSAVPEPTGLLLFTTGILGLVGRQFRGGRSRAERNA